MDFSGFLSDTSVSRSFGSDVPKVCKEEECLLGVDEAGRGPVLGPMVYGICYCPLKEETRLKSMKCVDSKTLSEGAREIIFDEIHSANDFMGWMLDVISPNVICNNMLKRSKYNLNYISHDSAIGLISKAIEKGVNVKEVYVDTVGDPNKYQAKISETFPGIKVTVAKKADSTYPIVSAASICAKVARDNILKKWQFVENLDIEPQSWGSGYPGDPTTKKFLSSQLEPVFGFPQLVRFSWATASKILEDKAAAVEWEEEIDVSDGEAKQTTSILSYFKHSPVKRGRQASPQKQQQHQFFTERCLHPTTSWNLNSTVGQFRQASDWKSFLIQLNYPNISPQCDLDVCICICQKYASNILHQ